MKSKESKKENIQNSKSTKNSFSKKILHPKKRLLNNVPITLGAALILLVVLSTLLININKGSNSRDTLDTNKDQNTPIAQTEKDSSRTTSEELKIKYQTQIDKAQNNEEKSNLYSLLSIECKDINDFQCSLESWENRESLTDVDYKYYYTLGNLLRANNKDAEAFEAYKKSYEGMSNDPNLKDEYKSVLLELKEYINANS